MKYSDNIAMVVSLIVSFAAAVVMAIVAYNWTAAWSNGEIIFLRVIVIAAVFFASGIIMFFICLITYQIIMAYKK